MSKLQLPGGEDHPEAAGKHLDDASVLNAAGRPDGAAYHAGYVVESSLKSVLLFELGLGAGKKAARQLGHNLRGLSLQALSLASMPSAKTALYLPRQTVGHSLYSGWRETLRYQAPGSVGPATAQEWLAEAKAVYESTVVPMRLDGVI